MLPVPGLDGCLLIEGIAELDPFEVRVKELGSSIVCRRDEPLGRLGAWGGGWGGGGELVLGGGGVGALDGGGGGGGGGAELGDDDDDA